jgi:hypothetical protein
MEKLWKLSVEQGGLTKLEKRIFKRAVTIPKETWSDAMKTVMAQAGKNLEKKGINPVSKMQELLFKSSNFVSKKWYRRLPAILAHDLATLSLIHKILKHYNIENESEKLSIEKICEVIEDSKSKGTTKEVFKNLDSSLKTNSTPEEYNKTIDSLYQKSKPVVPDKPKTDTATTHQALRDLLNQ